MRYFVLILSHKISINTQHLNVKQFKRNECMFMRRPVCVEQRRGGGLGWGWAGGFGVSRLKWSSCRGLKEPGRECVTRHSQQHQHRHTYSQSRSPSRGPRHRKSHLSSSLRHRRVETTSAPVGGTERGRCKWQRLELFVTEGRAARQFIRKRNHSGRLPPHRHACSCLRGGAGCIMLDGATSVSLWLSGGA